MTTTSAIVRPRPVFCVTGHERGDRAVADDACAGRFTELGTTLDLGPRPDWLGARFPADEEWRIAWSKCYWGLDLAAAYAATGDRRYPRAWERLVGSWIDQVPLGVDSTDTVARRMANWVYAWNAFADVPAFPGLADPAVIVESLAVQATWLRDHLTPARNHRTLELYALFVVALALPEIDPGGALRDFAVAELEENLADDFHPDGVHVEASTHYHLIVTRSFVGLRENARRFGIPLSPAFDGRLARALEFGAHVHRPDGEIPALSDADAGSYAELLALGADLLDRPDLRWVATRGAAGTPPRATGAGFPDGGYHVQRSGWGAGETAYADERFLVFDCGPVGAGGHGHYDALSVEVAAGGRPLVVDPGRFTYHEGEPNLRHWFKGTAAHNTVLVDGLDQTEYRRGKPKGAVAATRFRGRVAADGLDVLWGEVTTPRYDARHERRIAFVAGEYWIVEDRLTASRPHRYDQRWHLAPEADGAVVVADGAVRAPGLALVFAGRPTLALEPGWYAPAYGIRHPAPVVSAVVADAARAALVTAIVPMAGDRPEPRLALADEGDLRVVTVTGVGPDGAATDTVAWSRDGRRAHWRREPAATGGGGGR